MDTSSSQPQQHTSAIDTNPQTCQSEMHTSEDQPNSLSTAPPEIPRESGLLNPFLDPSSVELAASSVEPDVNATSVDPVVNASGGEPVASCQYEKRCT